MPVLRRLDFEREPSEHIFTHLSRNEPAALQRTTSFEEGFAVDAILDFPLERVLHAFQYAGPEPRKPDNRQRLRPSSDQLSIEDEGWDAAGVVAVQVSDNDCLYPKWIYPVPRFMRRDRGVVAARMQFPASIAGLARGAVGRCC